ncbi:hypothetical protein BJ165DRAFT_1438287 [Panaeolus papilionaceus]|nr:hypothetical protein BJ165DRAFT_1438287 [Panaeolus papilionaceus]
MYGHWHHFRHPFMYRGPSRLLWFAIGAVTASWFIKRKDERRVWGHCRRPALGPNDLPQQSPDDQDPWKARATEFSRTINNLNPPDGPVTPPWDEKEFQQQREHFAKVSRQAGEAMSDLTESTLETVIAAAQAMRSKLSDNRKRREIEEEQHRRNPVVEQPQNSSDEPRDTPTSRLV